MSTFTEYCQRLNLYLTSISQECLHTLISDLNSLWNQQGTLFLCGNGGSAGNASHLANDFTFGAGFPHKPGLSVESLSANSAVLTCLANDIGYEHIYSYQLMCKAKKSDIVIFFSGSGNSPNILKALQECKKIGCKSYAVLGFDGGSAITLADVSIHVPCNDMQICEDIQLILGHYIIQCLNNLSNPASEQSSLYPIK